VKVMNKLKWGLRILMIIAILASILSTTSLAAADGDYTYIVTNGEAQITGYTGSGGVVTIPITLGGVFVTSIGSSAFRNCRGLTSISIPQGIASIGNDAFYDCVGLTSISLPQGLTSIGDKAFWSCWRLTSINIPQSVTSIGSGAFYNCAGLANISIPDGVTSIADYAFDMCIGLKNISISQSVTRIGIQAFNGCTGLTSISIPQGVTSIGFGAFCGCESLSMINIPESVSSIGVLAFSSCSSLTSISIPQGVASIGMQAFYNSGLTNINVALGNENYSSINGILLNKAGTILIACPGVVTMASIPDGVTSIADFAFALCKGLTSISIPQGVTSIGDWAFGDNIGLASISLPEGLVSIGDYAFSSCTSLTSINLRQGLTSIGYGAFGSCIGLTSIYLPEGLYSIGDYAFAGCGITRISMPKGLARIGFGAFSGCTDLNLFKFNSATTTIGEPRRWGNSCTIPIQAKIIGYDPSPAKDYATGNGMMFEVIVNDEPSLILEEFSFNPNVFSQDLAMKAANFTNLISEPSGLKALQAQFQDEKYLHIDLFNGGSSVTEDNVTFIIADKYVNYNGEIKRLTVVTIKGTDGVQWLGNMDITGSSYDDTQINHTGFETAKEDVLEKLNVYLDQYNIDETMLLVTGHSRGAAVANLVAASMTERKEIPESRISDVFAYTFATPNVTTQANKELTNIYNFCFEDDFVPQVPLTEWGYDKNGITFIANAYNLEITNQQFMIDMAVLKVKAEFNWVEFDKEASKAVLNHVKNNWPSTKDYYEKKTYSQYPISNRTAYWFFRNAVGQAASAQEGEDYKKALLISYVVNLADQQFSPIASFFATWIGFKSAPLAFDRIPIGGRKSIYDTHEMSTYYLALKNSGFVPDTEKPVIIINGAGNINLALGAIYYDRGAVVTDNTCPDLRVKVTYTKNGNKVFSIDTFMPGTYVVHYNAIDNAGNAATEVIRTVVIDDIFSILTKSSSNYSITLTTGSSVNYNLSEIQKLKIFAQQGDNLQKLGWNLDDVSTWNGVLWEDAAERKIVGLDLKYKGLTGALDLNGLSSLENLDFSGNAITSVDLSSCSSLLELNCSFNQLSQLSITNATALKILNCTWNVLENLDVDGCNSLEKLSCNNNKLTSLNVTTNIQLIELYCGSNDLAMLDLVENTALEKLSCEQNFLDVQPSTAIYAALQTVRSRTNSWVKAEPQNMPVNPVFNTAELSMLTSFASQDTNAAKLQWDLTKPQGFWGVEWVKVGNEYRVKRISMDSLGLTGDLDLSGIPNLETVSCNNNQLISINVANCAALRFLSCNNASVGILGITNCAALTVLNCENNYLDVSASSPLLSEINVVEHREASLVNYAVQKIAASLDMFNQSEYNSFLEFANISDNLAKLAWDLTKPGEWSGVVWELYNGQYRVKEISFSYEAVTGSLDVSGFDGLTKLDASMTELTSVSLPDSITTIEPSMFYDCSEMVEITLSNNLTNIRDNAFYHCSRLASIIIPQSVTSIDNGAFTYCSSLKTIRFDSPATTLYDSSDTIPAITKILGYDPSIAKDYATKYSRIFEVIAAPLILQSISITNPATKLSYYVGDELDITGLVITGTYSDNSTRDESIVAANLTGFNSATTATDQVLTITVGDKTTNYTIQIVATPVILQDGDYAYTVTEGEAQIAGYTGVGRVVAIPSTLGGLPVTSIGGNALRDLTSLTSITISDSVASIGNSAFYGCSNLNSMTMPDSVTSIGGLAFNNCSSLSSITMSSSIINIGEAAFGGCSSLTDIYFIGNISEWSTIIIGSMNAPLNSATLHAVSITGIGIATLPNTVIYEPVDQINSEGLTITIYYSDGSSRIEASGYTLNYNFHSLGENAVTVLYLGQSSTFNVNIAQQTHIALQYPEYSIDSLRLFSESGIELQTIPQSAFTLELTVTNLYSEYTDLFVLATYDKDGRFLGFQYFYGKPSIGNTISFYADLDNSDDKIVKIKAFVWSAFSNLAPLAVPYVMQ